MLGEEGPGLLDDGHWENILIVVNSLGEMRGGKVWGPSLGHTSGTCHIRVRVRIRIRVRA